MILVSFTVIISAKMLEITENPAFCGKNCHIMRPYYDSWRSSCPVDWVNTHKTQVLMGKVCNDCHQPKFCSDCHATGKVERLAK
ncbi:MAG: hypothetical protein OIN87_07680 [Candidatus Methanoperedens sp.]|nr:hypothetical protein [Candidatus Methanoperedens sp.]